jgi:hypothetical protein
MKAFIDLVSRMRSNQRDYFRTRSPESLLKSKELEKAVDNWLEEIDQLKLFKPENYGT